MGEYGESVARLGRAIEEADAVLVGAGSGLSTAAGYTYDGERFEREFHDFIERYHFRDMYSAGFYPFATEEEKWAYWSRHIYCNRYDLPQSPVHRALLSLVGGRKIGASCACARTSASMRVAGRDYFVLTTNVDHLFQLNGFDKGRLFYTQGDYGLWQCKTPCHEKTYDNEETVRRMVAEQEDMRIPSALVPRCPVCGGPMEMNLRADDTFVEDEGWHRAADRYRDFLERHRGSRILFLELGVGMNTPGIIKFPFWRMTEENPAATYACINQGEAYAPEGIEERSICIDGDIGEVLSLLAGED